MAPNDSKTRGAEEQAVHSVQSTRRSSGLVVAEEDDRSTLDGDNSTEYTDETEETDDSDETETESVVTSSTTSDDDEDEDDEEGESVDEDDDEDDEEETEEEETEEDDDSDTSNHTMITEQSPKVTAGLSSAAIRQTQNASAQPRDPSEPLDLEVAKAFVASATHSDPVPASLGAESILDPNDFIKNPFAEQSDADSELGGLVPKTSKLHMPDSKPPQFAIRHHATNQKAEQINDSEYDLILARMVAQNRKLNQDPRAMRRSALGIGKLRESFERLQQRNRPGFRNEAEGVGTRSEEFGIGRIVGKNASHDESNAGEDHAETIDWEYWGNLINNYSAILTTSPVELSKAIYSGIPAELRGMMWQLLSSSKDEELEAQYAKYLALPGPHDRAIRRDLNRTFPAQEYFKDAKGVGQEQLFNVVKAYSLFDPECGYCQGMQFIVGSLLLNMPDEEAFSTLVRLMQNYDLRGHFIPNMPSLQLRLYQFDRLMEENLPLLHVHFVRRGIKSSMYASQWFMTLVYRILDSVFAEGIEAMFRFALALLHKNESKLLTLEFEECLNYLKLNLLDAYMVCIAFLRQTDANDSAALEKPNVRINELVRDAFAIKISPFTLDSLANEFYDQAKSANERTIEMEALRMVNRNLRLKVQSLEEQLNQVSSEHVDLVKRVVMSKLSQEEMAEELVRYKVMYAEVVLQNEVANRQDT
ncbi:GTPase-activating protein [Malassezia yamatoensis]|uniref:GTPase-activating protein n=1 Tax=Malassezia yamatoensis TaxID=253288 RepID=A0AAJ5YQ29_9BASI|nr:GTPase-activating protein [Malassezia yamatoensis]